MKKSFRSAACVASLLALALPLTAGPAAANMTYWNPPRKSAPVPAKPAAVAPTVESAPAVTVATAKPARTFRLVTSGPPKNATTHIVYLGLAPGGPSSAAHAN